MNLLSEYEASFIVMNEVNDISTWNSSSKTRSNIKMNLQRMEFMKSSFHSELHWGWVSSDFVSETQPWIQLLNVWFLYYRWRIKLLRQMINAYEPKRRRSRSLGFIHEMNEVNVVRVNWISRMNAKQAFWMKCRNERSECRPSFKFQKEMKMNFENWSKASRQWWWWWTFKKWSKTWRTE